jgi:hypothetical protein
MTYTLKAKNVIDHYAPNREEMARYQRDTNESGRGHAEVSAGFSD